MRKNLKWLVAGPLAVALAVVGGTFVYINFIKEEAPERLTLEGTAQEAPVTGEAPDGVDGTWKIGEGSEAGYRVKEILFGQSATAAGRTEMVTGTMTLEGAKVAAGSFEVGMASIESDESKRDNQFRTRIMDTATYPKATFTLTQPIDLGSVPAEGTTIQATAVGEMTLRGTTKTVEIPLETRLEGSSIVVVGALAINFPEWQIPNPSGGPAEVGDDGEMEFRLVLTR